MKWSQFLLFFILLVVTVCTAGEVKHGLVKQITLPDGQVVVIAEGQSEPRSIGSYSVRLYSACFLHDLKYWAGYPDEDIARLTADSELMIDIGCLTGSTTMAETMFQGTRRGGYDMFQQSFSWGFGRE